MNETFRVYADCTRLVYELEDRVEAVELCKSLHSANPEKYHEVWVVRDGKEFGIFQLKPEKAEERRR